MMFASCFSLWYVGMVPVPVMVFSSKFSEVLPKTCGFVVPVHDLVIWQEYPKG